MIPVDPSIHIWFGYAIICAAILLYASERVAIELTSIGIIACLLVFFYIFPVRDAGGENLLGADALLAGFGEPALLAILGLLVIGQAMVQTGAAESLVRFLIPGVQIKPAIVFVLVLILVAALSAFLNNTPVVVIFIPVLSALAERLNHPISSVMIPLSFVAILGGMTTLIGSSTNLLVAGAYSGLGGNLGFFDMTVPGLLFAAIGLVYVFLVVPRILPDRAPLARSLVETGGKQFISQIDVHADSGLVGQKAVAGLLPGLPSMTVRLIQRGEQAFLPPFEGVILEPGDVIIVAATRTNLMEMLASSSVLHQNVMELPEGDPAGTSAAIPTGDRMLAEVVIAPASRMDGRTLGQISFHHQTNCVALGIQRRSRMIRTRMNDIRLEAGDVLLVFGHRADVLGLRGNRDLILLEWSASELPAVTHAKRALAVFCGVVITAATGLMPISVAALGGAALLIALGCLNVRQAARAVDRRIILIVAAALALGTTLQETGGALYLAQILVETFSESSPRVILSVFFLLVAALTNVLSNNATAVLFTPIGVNIAVEIGTDPLIFVLCVIFAANCSFATPMGYQTNLLVMASGHYRFSDYLRTGIPLIILIWVAFSLFMPWYYGI